MRDEFTEIEGRLLSGQKKGQKTRYFFECLNCKNKWQKTFGYHIQQQKGNKRSIIDYEKNNVYRIVCPKCRTSVKIDIEYQIIEKKI